MKLIGKILFYNAQDGQGIIITSKKEKINFHVSNWDDFDTMPELGLEVRFMYKNSLATAIVSSNYQEEEIEEPEIEPESEEEIPEAKIEPEPEEEIPEAKIEPEPEEEIPEPKIEPEPEEEIPEPASEPEPEEENKNQSNVEHFKEEENIAEITTNEEDEDEIAERVESVTVSLNLPIAVSNYFNIIDENITKRKKYQKVEGRLDYLVIRRFLWTTFNNLSEIDLHIVTPKVKAMSDDLRAMANIYDDFARKIKYPVLAYEEVFLSCQAEYKKMKDGAEKIIKKLTQLKGSEKHIGGVLKVKKENIEKDLHSQSFNALETELKSLNGTYVDIVHMMAELDERYKHDISLLKSFEDEYKEDFYELFNQAAIKYKKDIIDILSAQAFILDNYLWQQAKTSKSVKLYFHKTGIKGEFNTKTYLKYYLDTQDATKANETNKKLFKLYDYLLAKEKKHVMIMLTDVNDILDFEVAISKIDKSIAVKGFIDEKQGLKWAIKHSIQVLILESQLNKMNADIFLKYYKKYILVIPKIILLGNTKTTDSYTIQKLLSNGISAQKIALEVKELLKEKKQVEK